MGPGLLDRGLVLLFAAPCASCLGPLPRPTVSPVCETCWSTLRRYPPVLVAAPPPEGVDWLRSLGPYEGSLRAILHALKYDGRQTLARRLAAELRPLILVEQDDSPATLVVPVPLHPAKCLRRGFNQAELLARALPVHWPVRLALARRHAAQTQTRFSRDARQRNVAEAFSVQERPRWWPGAWRSRDASLAGAHVVLVDDVVTTGATLAACAAALRRAGVTRVGAVTVARTEMRHPGTPAGHEGRQSADGVACAPPPSAVTCGASSAATAAAAESH